MANRDRIDASIDISAPPADVWQVVSDLKRMGEWSPQCRKMIIRGSQVQAGTKTINVNRDGWKVWPTRSEVIEFDPDRRIAFVVKENRTVWSFDLEPIATGTRLTEARTAPRGVSKLSNVLSQHVLGGTTEFEAALEAGVNETLRKIKAEVERAT